MKMNKEAIALVVAGGLFLGFGPAQAKTYVDCIKQPPGWHMVPKCCNLQHAQNWQQYNSGYLLPPVINGEPFPLFPWINVQ